MTTSNDSSDDRALLARLNALKKSTIDLDARKSSFEPSTSGVHVDPAPGHALHADLMSRFKSLNGQSEVTGVMKETLSGQGLDLLADEDGKTVEDLLAELGPEDSWTDLKDEEDQIKDLLQTAHQDLDNIRRRDPDNNHDSNSGQHNDGFAVDRHALDAQLPHGQRQLGPTNLSEEGIDREADEYLAQVLDELQRQPKTTHSESQDEQPGASRVDHESDRENRSFRTTNPRSAPDEDIEPPPSYAETTVDDDLASRFANLGLPSVPTTIKSPTPKPATHASKQPQKGFTDEEIDSWCIICDEDATLRCIGCDEDLYCTKCWLDGHKGSDAGHDERTHKAVQFNKGGGIEKQPARRVMTGA